MKPEDAQSVDDLKRQLEYANEMVKKQDATIANHEAEIERLEKGLREAMDNSIFHAKHAEELEKELKQLRKRTSPVTEPCSCPEFCDYHKFRNFRDMKQIVEAAQRLVEAEKARGETPFQMDCLLDDLRKAVEAFPAAIKDFKPIEVKGEPLSEQIKRERR